MLSVCRNRGIVSIFQYNCLRKSSNLSQGQLVKLGENYVCKKKVNVCSKFSKNSKFLRPWFLRYIPDGGLPYEIDYIDTMPDARDAKVIVALHNTPGSYYDFFEMIATFGRDYRIIIPTFPDFNYTLKTGCFWHSAEEKSEFVVDFLRSINIDRVDCLIAHSMGAYTASYLWLYANWEDYFKLRSVCLLSPVGMFKFSRMERLRLRLMSNMSRYSLSRKLLANRIEAQKRSRLVAPIMSAKAKKGSMLANIDVSCWKALSVHLSGYEKYHFRLRMLAQKRIPTLFQFSSNDRLYTPNVYYDQLFELGVESEAFDIYEQYENELIQKATDLDSPIRAVDFRSAGHYMFKTHPDIIHSYIDELLWKADSQEEIGILPKNDEIIENHHDSVQQQQQHAG